MSFLSLSNSLTETIAELQTVMENLQSQVEELKTVQAERMKRELAEQRRSIGAQSVSCLKELYDLQQDRSVSTRCCMELQDVTQEHLSERKLCSRLLSCATKTQL